MWNSLSTTAAPLITGGTFGPARPFSVKMRAIPGWSYTGGDYLLALSKISQGAQQAYDLNHD